MAVVQSHGGRIENVVFAHMIVETRLFDERWWGRGEPIFVSVRARGTDIGHVRRLTFVDIQARSENGVVISAETRGLLDGILLDNVRLELDRWTSFAGNRQDLRPPRSPGLREHPTSAIFVENAADVTLRHCSVGWGRPDPTEFRHVLEARAADGLVLEDVRGSSTDPQRWPAVVQHVDAL